MVIFKGCIFHEWALIFNFTNFSLTNGYCGPYRSNTYFSRIELVLAKFLKCLENFHLIYVWSRC